MGNNKHSGHGGSSDFYCCFYIVLPVEAELIQVLKWNRGPTTVAINIRCQINFFVNDFYSLPNKVHSVWAKHMCAFIFIYIPCSLFLSPYVRAHTCTHMCVCSIGYIQGNHLFLFTYLNDATMSWKCFILEFIIWYEVAFLHLKLILNSINKTHILWRLIKNKFWRKCHIEKLCVCPIPFICYAVMMLPSSSFIFRGDSNYSYSIFIFYW